VNETLEVPEIIEGSAPPVRRRRRRRTVDHPAQTRILITSLLGARGSRGANQTELETVVHWARAIHAESAEVATLAKRPRLRKADGSAERVAANLLNRSLLDGVIQGTLSVDVSDEGQILFRGA
jgi:hypothetical protein